MGLSDGAFAWIKSRYSGEPRRIAKRLGIHSTLNSVFWEMRFLFSDEPIRLKTHSGTLRTILKTDHSLASYPEQAVVEDILGTIRANDVFYDIGANVGRYSIPVGIAHPGVDIVAFEPNQRNVELLEHNAALNNVMLTVIDAALSDASGEMELLLSDKPGRHRLALGESDAGVERLTVPTYRCDELIQNGEISPPDVVKIDVEGAEKNVIDGLEETLSQGGCRALYIEVHPNILADIGTSVDQLREQLHSFGFEITSLDRRRAIISGETVEQLFIKAEKQ